MSRFVIETTYHLPVYRQRVYEAASVGDACQLAIADEGWEDEDEDVDTSGETFVTGIWENADRAYQGTARMIPDAFRETIRRKADLFDRLVVLLRELAQPLGLSEVAFRRWLPSVLAALAEADAIQGRSSMLPGEPTEDMP
ncbi:MULTISPECIES: hypothetical protein [unclassified Agrobacterium]|uniref:hypothetical protein n=1 Tax=unclassified Agrobacterium TaxID=2632611 RepID=UPI002448B1BC|nr:MULTISPECIES: hypothetical protein [unclassified Agrobacterium]MDH0615596.1 hypothetical protein [Agrobacterium sp. GD03872]MDH0698735.1 hypothetical protein [Agrobacterium sp. GD03871]MDH1061408.1 hypothetical protein [Agrobacterium sp. GD03992]MDH2212657.1 hypothetical protein [Agrobacterium sp. GD03643]MDH2220990.1 hypothetical protein [Agrobacterium sp. GD03638]